jgi:hypothetical protein
MRKTKHRTAAAQTGPRASEERAGGSARRAPERAMGADETRPLAAAPAGPAAALEDVGAEAEAVASEDSYAAQLETVRRLRASGASAEAVRAAAARLKELKRGAYEKLPRGTVGRRKKRRAALDAGVTVLDVDVTIKKRDAPAIATYPPIDVPPTDEDGFVRAFDVPNTTSLLDAGRKRGRRGPGVLPAVRIRGVPKRALRRGVRGDARRDLRRARKSLRNLRQKRSQNVQIFARRDVRFGARPGGVHATVRR